MVRCAHCQTLHPTRCIASEVHSHCLALHHGLLQDARNQLGAILICRASGSSLLTDCSVRQLLLLLLLLLLLVQGQSAPLALGDLKGCHLEERRQHGTGQGVPATWSS